MKKQYIVATVAVGLVLIAGAVYFFISHNKKSVLSSAAQPNFGDQVAVKQRPIAQAETATAGQADVSLGKVDTVGVSIDIPKDSFASSTGISLVTPEKIPAYDAGTADMLGAPIEIAAGNKPVRLDDGANLTFKIPAGQVTTSTDAQYLRVAYYNGQEWDYLKPDSVDLKNNTMSFRLYHFSLLAPTKLKGDAKITNDWIKAKVLDDALKTNLAKPADTYSAQALDLSMEKLNITDPAVKNQVLQSLLKDPEYQKMQDYYTESSQVFDDKLKLLIGAKIMHEVPNKTLHHALEGLEVMEGTEAISKALGNAIEGDYKEGAKEIGDFITNQFVLGVAGKAAVAITNYEIKTWKNSEVEAAYKAYRDGSSGYFYGYNNDPKDFDTVWDQMRGVRRQIELEAIDKENEVRKESGMKPLTEEQEETLRERLKEQFKGQFESRFDREKELGDNEQKLIKIMDGLKAAGVLDSTTGPVGLDKGYDTETKLDVVGHFIDKMMQDTNRFELTDKTGLVSDKAISVDDLAQGVRLFFSGPNGKQDYAKFLKDRFNITLSPKLSDLAGKWTGTFTIKSVDIPQELKDQAKGKKDENGCDFNMDLSQLIGKSQPITLNITAKDDSSGTIAFGSGGSQTPAAFTYTDGTIKAVISQKGAVATLTLAMGEDQANYTASGPLNVTYAEGKVKISADVSASKPKPVVKPATGGKK